MLTIYEKHPEADAYKVGPSYAPYALVARANRFTDAELAAEYWNMTYFGAGAQFNESSSGDEYSEEFWETHYGRVNALYRMATLPHFDGAS
jgi:hypothetical protein